jgi:hypothetical protein
MRSPYHMAMLYEITSHEDPRTVLEGYLRDVLGTGGLEPERIDRIMSVINLDMIINNFLSHNQDEE